MIADQHPDIEHLDAYADGDVSASRVERHLQDCPQCRDTVTALQRVRRDLAGLASVTMPEDVAARLQATLRSEGDNHRGRGQPAGFRSAAGLPGLPLRSAPPRDLRRNLRGGRGRSSRSPQVPVWLTAAAVFLIFVIGTVGLVGMLGRSPTPTAAGSATSELAAPPAADAAGALRDETTRSAAGSAKVGDAEITDSDGAVLAHSGHALDIAGVPQHVRDLLSGRISNAVHVSPGDLGSSTAWPPATTASGVTELVQPELRMCYLGLATQTGASIVALDLVAFGGRRAVLVVLSSADSPDWLRIVVLDEKCGVTNIAAALWYSTTAPRQPSAVGP